MRRETPLDSVTLQPWDEVEKSLDELASFAASEATPRQYHQRLLKATVQLLAGEGGAVWMFDSEGRLQLEHQIGLEKLTVELTDEEHNALLVEGLHHGEPLSTPPRSASRETHRNPSTYLLSTCPIRDEELPVGVVEVFHQRSVSPAAQRGIERLLLAVTELAADYHRRRQLVELRRSVEAVEAIHQFAVRVHRSLDPRATAYQIVNESRRLLGCDRVTLQKVVGPRCETAAVSGVDQANRRAESVDVLEQLAQLVLHSGTPIWHGGEHTAASTSALLLEQYIDSSNAACIALLPLWRMDESDDSDASDDDTTMCGVLVLEQMSHAWPSGLLQHAPLVAKHSAAAMYNAEQHGSLPLLFVSRWLRSVGWLFSPTGRPRAAIVGAAVVLLVLAFLLIPAELRVTARGHVHPAKQARIFASYDADVELISAKDGKTVNVGDPLLTLRSHSLEAERDQVLAKLAAAKSRLQVIGIELATVSQANNELQRAQLAAERREVELLQGIHQDRLDEVNAKLNRLNVTSPLKGEVLSWMLENLLADRPVTRGQHLLTIGDVDGAWLVELNVHDYHIDHVLAAQQSQADINVRFGLESLPGRTFHGRVQSVAPSATRDEQGRSTVKVLVEIQSTADGRRSPGSRQNELRPGAAAVARISCGTTCLGYAWFHDLIDAVRNWTWL